MKIITGRGGKAHITPLMDSMWHQGIAGLESCILGAYENFKADIISSNEIRVRSGIGMLQGRFFCIEPNTYDSAVINNGTQGENRIDLIVARWTVNQETDTESADILAIQGAPVTGTPTAPSAVEGSLDDGDLIVDCPLYEVYLEGVNITEVVPRFTALPGIFLIAPGGVVDLKHGGTGATTAAAARNALGLGNTTGALPIANGGTGATTAALARNALGLGNTTGALPIANGGTGATTAALARATLGAAEKDHTHSRLISNNMPLIAYSGTYTHGRDGITSEALFIRTEYSDYIGGIPYLCLGTSSQPFAHVYTDYLNVYAGRITCLPSYENTTTYATNTYVNSSGIFTRTTNTSSREIKHDIKPLEDGELCAEKLYDVGVYQFKYNEGIITDEKDPRYMKDLPGMIIEDLYEKYPIAVDASSGDVKEWSWNAQYLIPPMLKLIQEQKKKLDGQDRLLSQLKERMDFYEQQNTLD